MTVLWYPFDWSGGVLSEPLNSLFVFEATQAEGHRISPYGRQLVTAQPFDIIILLVIFLWIFPIWCIGGNCRCETRCLLEHSCSSVSLQEPHQVT